jgi:hypothetical protein
VPKKVAAAVALLAALIGLYFLTRRPYPSDRTPEGAYLRIAQAVMEERPRDAFAYLETEAQWACFTTRELRQKALARVRANYPQAEQGELLRAYEPDASAADGAELFVLQARRRGWLGRLRRDLSGVLRVEVEGERASVVTVRGTRYPLRRRDNGIWGLTLFTAELQAEAERAARDLEVVSAASADYDRARERR